MRHNEIFHTFGGVVQPHQAPSVETVAVCLMRESRYTGNGKRWFPVGLHCMVVADLLPDNHKLHGLVHDQPECITGDIPHDLKSKAQRVFEDLLSERFYRSVNVCPPTTVEWDAVKEADNIAVNGEVWADCGTTCLGSKYPDVPAVTELVRHYADKYSYADCLDYDGRAVKDYIKKFELYKALLLR